MVCADEKVTFKVTDARTLLNRGFALVDAHSIVYRSSRQRCL